MKKFLTIMLILIFLVIYSASIDTKENISTKNIEENQSVIATTENSKEAFNIERAK